MISDEAKPNLNEIVKWIGGKNETIRWLEEQRDERIAEILSIEMMIATIQGVH
jgi:hypothetical protein